MRSGAVAVVLVLASLAGCQSARYVVRESDHGVVAIPLDTPKYRREAEELMREHFPDGYTVVREEERPVEETMTSQQQLSAQFAGAGGGRPSAVQAGGRGTTGPPTEWRITYFRDQPASPQTAAAAAAAQPALDAEPGESLFSTAGMIDPARTSN
ncbi:MAG TPA: hypothetical protein VML55_08405 [Planctomycetaceae bacterium]|nr:hypothetical protein [Planctomycetaceae bacterium]